MAVSQIAKQLLLIGVPAIMSLVASITLVHRFLTAQGRVWVQGTFTGIVEGADSDGPLYRSRIMFDVDGQPIEVLDEMSFGYKAHQIGQQLWVGYRPDEPEQARVWRIWPSLILRRDLLYGSIRFMAWNEPYQRVKTFSGRPGDAMATRRSFRGRRFRNSGTPCLIEDEVPVACER